MASHMDLLDAIPLDTVNDGLVLAALEERRKAMLDHGGSALAAKEFWKEDDLHHYRSAVTWWPADAPQTCALPTLRELCLHVAGPASAKLLPAIEVLSLLANRAAEWLVSEGRDVKNPNETQAEKRKRQAREGMRAHRQLMRDPEVDPAGAKVKALYAAYIEACRVRKEAARAHDATVAEAKAAWEAAKAEAATHESGPPEEPAVEG